jgi:hypothetical protein
VRCDMEFWKEVRRQVLTNELSQRAACAKYALGWHTLKKILAHDEPPGYRLSQPRWKRKLEPFLPIIHQILEADRQAPRKQRHTAERIFERLRDEHGYSGGQTVVKDAVRAGNQLDLWAAARRLTLQAAALDLCRAARISPPWLTAMNSPP